MSCSSSVGIVRDGFHSDLKVLTEVVESPQALAQGSES